MELGPKQKEWIKSLREHPERQNKRSSLGFKTSDGYKACCLGELGLICGLLKFDENGILLDGVNKSYPERSYREMGLISCVANNKKNDPSKSLSWLNDSVMTWPEIADLVESNPEEYFTKSF